MLFRRCLGFNVSVGTNVGKTVKLSPNSESTGEKLLKWFATLLRHSRYPHFPSVLQSVSGSVSLIMLCIVKPRRVGGGGGEDSLWVRFIYF